MSLVGRCMVRLVHTCVSSSIRSTQLLKQSIPACSARYFTVTSCRQCEQSEEKGGNKKEEGKKGYLKREISYQESIKYMDSEAFKLIYGNEPVWKYYKRNFKGHFYPKPRATCTINRKIISASPCPICRDDYLVVNYQNTTLLNQFVSKLTGNLLNPKMTGLCMKQYKNLKLAVAQAKDYGLMERNFHFRKYDYSYYTDLAYKKRKALLGDESDVSDNTGNVDERGNNEPEIDTEHKQYSERRTVPVAKRMTKSDKAMDHLQHKYNQ